MDHAHGHPSIDIVEEAPSTETSYVRSKVCAGSTCGFSDAKTSYKDAEERVASMWKLLGGVVVCFIFMGVEVVGGLEANSLAILTDAAHLLSDVGAFVISLFSVWASGWEATPRQSYGFFRIEILGTLVSIQMIWLLTGILVYEATDRLLHGAVEVQGSLMFVIAFVGLLVNLFMIFILGHDHAHGHHYGHGDHERTKDDVEGMHMHNHGLNVTKFHHQHHHHNRHHDEHEDHNKPLLDSYDTYENKASKRANINVHGAYLHVLGDSIQSVGVMMGAAAIWYNPKWTLVDPICTLLFSIIVLYTTINMLRDILEVLMESTPREIDATSLERGLCGINEVIAIHELHIWAITVGKVLLACHVKIRREANADMVLDMVVNYIRREYNISHVTIQIERE